MRQSHPHQHRADQPFAHQVNPLAKQAAQHRKPHLRAARCHGEGRKELLPFDLGHAGTLRPHRHHWAGRLKSRHYSREVLVGGQVDQVIPRPPFDHAANGRHHFRQRVRPVFQLGANAILHQHRQVFRRERGGELQYPVRRLTP